MGKNNSNYRPRVKLAHPPGHIFWKKEKPVDTLSLFIEKIINEYKFKSKERKNVENVHEDSEPTSDDCIVEGNKDTETQAKKINDGEELTKEDSTEASHEKADDADETNSLRENDRQCTKETTELDTQSASKQKKQQKKAETMDDEEDEEDYSEKARRIIERIYTSLFTNDLMFIKVFQMPPKDLCAENGLYFKQVGEREFECRLFIKRLIDQTSCQLVYGAQSDIPPGMAMYTLNDRMTNEQKEFTKEALGPCMDSEGHMTPAQMYPWFAMGVANTVQHIIEEDEEDKDNQSQNGQKETSDFEGVEVVGEFPIVKLVIPCEKDEVEDAPDSARESISLPATERSSVKSHVDEEQASQNKEASVKNAVKPMPAQWYPKGGRNSGGRDDTNQAQPGVIRTPRSSKQSKTETGQTFSSFSSDVGTLTDDIKEEPIVIVFKPAVKGYGLPRAIKLQHALPKQKPYCENGKQCLKEIQDMIDDGQSLWFLEASPITQSDNVEKSARFRSMFRKVGKCTKFWKISFDPILERIEKNMNDAYLNHEFPIDLKTVKAAVLIMKDFHGFKCIKDEYIDIAIMNTVKSNMLIMRSVGECVRKVLSYLHGVVNSRSCPNFLQPNVNIADQMDQNEAKWTADELKRIMDNVDNDPGYLLTCIGYNRKSQE